MKYKYNVKICVNNMNIVPIHYFKCKYVVVKATKYKVRSIFKYIIYLIKISSFIRLYVHFRYRIFSTVYQYGISVCMQMYINVHLAEPHFTEKKTYEYL